MVERSQCLPLVTEPPQDELTVHTAADDLDGYVALQLVVGSDSPVDGSHTALPDLFDKSIWTRKLSHHRVDGSGKRFQRRLVPLRPVKELVAGILIACKEFCYFLTKRGILAARVHQIACPPGRFQFERGVQELFDTLPAFRVDWLWPG
jgi:hypothetical protein